MKKIPYVIIFFAIMLGATQTGSAQRNAYAYWMKGVLKPYKSFSNYSFKVYTASTVRGVIKNNDYIDSTHVVMDSLWVYVENGKKRASFVGVDKNDYLSFTQKKINTTINFSQEWVAINSLSNNYGDYMHYAFLISPVSLYKELIWGYSWIRPVFTRMYDTVCEGKNFRILEWADSSYSINDIRMKEIVSVYVNPQTFLVERLTTHRLNNDVASLGIGAIYRDIRFSNWKCNYDGTEDKSRFNTDFIQEDFLVVKNEYPWIEKFKDQKTERDSSEKEWLKQEIVFTEEILNMPLINFGTDTTTLNKLDGWILIDSWYSSCYPCMKLMQAINKNLAEFDKRNIKILSLNTMQKPTPYLKAFCEKQGIDLDKLVFAQTDIDKAPAYPALLLINPQKEVVYKQIGSIRDFSAFFKKIDVMMK